MRNPLQFVLDPNNNSEPPSLMKNDLMFCPQAFGVPDPKVGEEICVFLRLRQGATLTEQDVRDYFRDKVGGQVRIVWELLWGIGSRMAWNYCGGNE